MKLNSYVIENLMTFKYQTTAAVTKPAAFLIPSVLEERRSGWASVIITNKCRSAFTSISVSFVK